MSTLQLLADLDRLGIQLEARGGCLRYSPKAAVTPAMADQMKAHTPLFQFCRVMPYGKCIGAAYTHDLDRPVIDVFLSLWTRRKSCRHALVLGVIIHEMLHFHAGMLWRKAGKGWWVTSHENEFWMDEARRLGPRIDAPVDNLKKPYERWPYDVWLESEEGGMERLEKKLTAREFPF